MLMLDDVETPLLVAVSTGVTEPTPCHSVQVIIALVGVPLRVMVKGLLVELETNSAYMNP